MGLSSGSDSELITQLLALSPPDGEMGGPDWTAMLHLFIFNPQSQSTLSNSLSIMHGYITLEFTFHVHTLFALCKLS